MGGHRIMHEGGNLSKELSYHFEICLQLTRAGVGVLHWRNFVSKILQEK